MSYISYISYKDYMSCISYVSDMSYVVRLYELCKLYEYYMNHSKSLEIAWNHSKNHLNCFEYIFVFKKISLMYKDGKYKLSK